VKTQQTLSLLILTFLFSALCLLSHAQRVGLVLSGGGARGFSEVGVIMALEENNIPIDYIAGTSSGAVVGSLYAQGLSAHQIDSVVHTPDFYNSANGIIDEDYNFYFRKKDDNASWITLKFTLDSVIQTSLPTNIVNSVPADYALMENTAGLMAKVNYNFDSLFVPFRCVAADIENKKTVVFRSGDLGQSVRASSAFPFYFKPILFDGKLLYDGGMYNNFPADVMLQDFKPDIVIGVNAAGSNAPTSEENIVSQIRAMMTTPTNFTVQSENGILIEPAVEKFGLFDFKHIDEIIQAGYKATMAKMDSIKMQVKRRSNPAELASKRKSFYAGMPKVLIDKVYIHGLNSKQAGYVSRIIKPSSAPVPLSRLKASYFQLVADDNIKSIYPLLKYDTATGYFNLTLDIVRERDLITQFGGNLASRPISEAFGAAQYNIWDSRSYSFYGNFYFGKLYTSGQFRMRMDMPSNHPYFLETDITLNQFDFFSSSTKFFTDVKPAYILKSDYFFGLNFGLPQRNKGKIITSAGYIRLGDNYYQTTNFLQNDTADETIFDGFTAAVHWERNTLNRKQYANQGAFFNLGVRFVTGHEYTIPGSTSVDRTESRDFHQWVQAKVVYENYYKRRGILRLGIYGEVVASNEHFFANYTSTVLAAPSFEPMVETKTLFLNTFHAHAYGGAGLRNVIMLRRNLDLRIEGYIFQPYQELIKTEDLKTTYGEPFAKRYFMASGGFVFNTPIAPVSMMVNYYYNQPNPFSFLFNIGFIIFNKGALD